MVQRILSVAGSHANGAMTVADLFAGTGAVATAFKAGGYGVTANDVLYFSYVLNKGTLEMRNQPTARMLELIDHLNHLTLQNSGTDPDSCFICQNYSPHEGCQRMYFQEDNALKIDLIRQEIEKLRVELADAEYYYLLACLLSAVPYVANITGTFAAYLKFWDKRTYNPLLLKPLSIVEGRRPCHATNWDVKDMARRVKADIAYLDPPYNQRQYLPNYHLLETIALYDRPALKGITGVRADDTKLSDFCRKGQVADAFRQVLTSVKCHYILLSYNNEGLLSTEELSGIVKDCGRSSTFRLYEYDHRRYKNKIPNNRSGLKEQLYFIEKC